MNCRHLVLTTLLLVLPLGAAVQAPPAAPSASPATSDPREIIRRTVENNHHNDQRIRDYTYIQRQETHYLDKNGGVKSTKSETHETMILYGEPVRRLVARDDQPLSGKEAQKEEDRINKWMEKRKNETNEEKQKRLAKENKDREEERAFVKEITDAYNFRMLPEEILGGRDAFVIDAEPRPGFQPLTKGGKYLPKFRFRVWIDKAEYQLAKLDAEAMDTVSWGLFLARLHPGSRLVIEQVRVNDEVWLPLRAQVQIGMRLALVKNYNLDVAVTYKNYQKFRSDARILSETPPQ